MNIYIYFTYFIIYSFIGFILETSYTSYSERKFVHRGFLNGPIIPIYGFGSIAIIFLFKDDTFVVTLFFGGMLVTSILEYVTSYSMEKIFQMRWWDYSDSKYNLNGRIKLKNSIFFGIGSVILIYFMHPRVINFVSGINVIALQYFSIATFIILIIDNIVTVTSIFGLKKKALELETAFKSRILSIEANLIHRRILRAFPNLASLKNPGIISRLRERISEESATKKNSKYNK